MEWTGWYVLSAIILVLLVLAFEKGPPDLVMLAALVSMWVLRIITTANFLKGFSSSGLATVGALFVVVKAVDASGALEKTFRMILGQKSSVRWARFRICILMYSLSGFFNNTPLVALMIPIVRDWARSRGFAPSVFLLAIDFSVIQGGLLTMIGTSTNLQVNDFLEQKKLPTFMFLEPGYVGLPVGAIALIVMLVMSEFRCLIPNNKGGLFRELREHGDDLVTTMELTAGSGFDGKKVLDVLLACKVPTKCLLKLRRPIAPVGPQPDEIGARAEAITVDLEDEKQKSSGRMPSGLETEGCPVLLDVAGVVEVCPVPEGEVAQTGDIILLSMSRDEVVDLAGRKALSGVRISSIHATEVVGPGSEFVEVVLGVSSPAVGRPIAEGPEFFHSTYRSGLLAIRQRGGVQATARQTSDPQRTESFVGWPLSAGGTFAAGDTVMLVAPVGADLPRADFLMITRVGLVPPPTRLYHYIPLVLFLVGLCVAASEKVDMLMVSMVLLLVFIAGGWVKASKYTELIDWRLLVLIGASTGMSEAMSASGLSQELASLIKGVSIPRWCLPGMLFAVEVFITEIVTNNAAVAIGLPLAVDLAKELNLKSHKPLTMAVMLGASTGYAVPMGYATHLMVMGPGGYSFGDFLKNGLIMDFVWVVGVWLLLPLIYPME